MLGKIRSMNGTNGIFVRLFLAAVCMSLVSAAEKPRGWQMGKVLDSDRSRYFAGTVGNASTTGSNTSTSETAVYRVYETFLIEGKTHVYLAQQRLRWRWSKPANLTVNGPVKFAVEKRKLFVIDDDRKEHEMEIIKQVLKQEPADKRP